MLTSRPLPKRRGRQAFWRQVKRSSARLRKGSSGEERSMGKNIKPHRVTKSHVGCELIYSKRWDAYWCLDCGDWAEPPCSDEKCEYCADRPAYPQITIV